MKILDACIDSIVYTSITYLFHSETIFCENIRSNVFPDMKQSDVWFIKVSVEDDVSNFRRT